MSAKFRQQPGLACENCRRKKRRCDRVRPDCGSCANTGAECVFTDNRTQRGPKKGQLQALRALVATLAPSIDHQQGDLIDSSPSNDSIANTPSIGDTETAETHIGSQPDHHHATGAFGLDFDFGLDPTDPTVMVTGGQDDLLFSDKLPPLEDESLQLITPEPPADEVAQWPEFVSGLSCSPCSNTFLDHPPSQCQTRYQDENKSECGELDDLVGADLDQLYFDRVHAMLPFIHQNRYTSWAKQPSKSKARVGLQLAMRSLAAVFSASYLTLGVSLHNTTRRILLSLEDEMEHQTPTVIPLEQIQAWLLVAYYEFMTMPHQRAMIAAGRAFRMMQRGPIPELHAFDMTSGYLSNMSGKAWSEAEEKRRTFWVAYCLDGLASLYHACPQSFQEDGIRIRLPAPESSFQENSPVRTGYAHEAITSMGSHSVVSPFAECAILLTVWGRSMAYGSHGALEGRRADVSPDSQSRYQWFNALLHKRRMLITEMKPPAEAPADSMLILALLVADSIVIQLINTLPPSPPLKYSSQLRPDKSSIQEASQAATRIVKLAKLTTKLSCFRAHPFLPSALYHSAQVLLSSDHTTVDGISIEDVTKTLRKLRDINYSALEWLRLIDQEDFSASRVQLMLGISCF